MATLTPKEIRAELGTIPAWIRKGKTIVRAFEFKDFAAAIKFVNSIARLAEKADHHPDIDIRWNKVTMALTTHYLGGLTAKDFDLARKIDRKAA